MGQMEWHISIYIHFYHIGCQCFVIGSTGQDFFINKGLVAAGLIAQFGIAYWSLTAIALLAQILMIALVFRLNRQHFSARGSSASMVPAE